MASGEEERYFLNPDAVSRHLFCSICQDVFKDPQRAPCGHSYCKECIDSWLQKKKICPEDRKPLSLKSLHYDFILANIIGDQLVACPFRNRGCDYVDQLQLLRHHKTKCKFNPENVPVYLRDDPLGKWPAKRKTTFSIIENVAEDGENEYDFGQLPVLGKPSLKMRLFTSDKKKQRLLEYMFNDKEK